MGLVLVEPRLDEASLARVRAAAPGFSVVCGSDPAALAQAEVWVPAGPRVEAATLDAAPALRWIHTFSAGVDRMDLGAMARRGIILTNSAGVHGPPMAEYVVMMVLALARDLPGYLQDQAAGRWQPRPAREVADLTMVIVGYGGIGREIASRASALGMRVIGVRNHPQPDQYAEVLPTDRLAEALAQADVVVSVLPATPATTGLLGQAAWQAVKPGAWFISVGRAAAVDEPALLAALDDGHLSAAVLDVFSREPLPAASPLWRHPRVLLTPHVSARSAHTQERCVDLLVDNLDRYVTAQPLRNRVDPASGY